MSRRKGPRRLSAEEKALWDRVVGNATRQPDRPNTGSTISPGPDRHTTHSPMLPFHVGERSTTPGPRNDVLPPLSQRLATQPVSMDHKAFTRMKRGKLRVEGRIDLHGMTLDQAHPHLIQFILSSQAAGKRLVLVITGKGRRGNDCGPIPMRQGVLKHQAPVWLRSPMLGPYVLQIAEAHQSHGGSGAYYVYLRRGR